MASFATPQRRPLTPTPLRAAPVAVEKEYPVAAMLPDRAPHELADRRPLIPASISRPALRTPASLIPHRKHTPDSMIQPITASVADMPGIAEQEASDTAREVAPEIVGGVVQARMSVKRVGFGAAGMGGGAGGALPIQRKNVTGLPDALKAGVEALSGVALDEVRVHYNSAKPAAVAAHAYAQGTEIHVGPGQEKHLPHEAWHVVQQQQGRVKPTVQVSGVAVNDDAWLEREADQMGTRSLAMPRQAGEPPVAANGIHAGASTVLAPVMQGAFIGGSAAADAALFEKQPVADEAIDLAASKSAAKAATLGITATNLKHYLNRHTFKYQPLSSSSTYPPQTGMFPIGTDKDDVKNMVVEAIGLVPDSTPVTSDIESVLVDLSNGLRVNLGALAGGKLQAFFPQGGTGFHSYTNVELQAIKKEKDDLEAPIKAAAEKLAKEKKDKKEAEKAEKLAKNKAFLAAKAAKAASPPTTAPPTDPTKIT